jgi:hypothetical protein
MRAGPGMSATELTSGTLDEVARQWNNSLRSASRQHNSHTLYSGRAFIEAARAAKAAGLPHYVVSAGLGLVGPEDKIPAYAMTTVGSTDENILRKCPQGTTATDWWRAALKPGMLANLIGKTSGRVFLALPSAYLEMVQDELLSLPHIVLTKTRIFTGGRETLRDSPLEEFVMPYDSRLDGPDSPIPGTKGDFASRALRHFIGLEHKKTYPTLSHDKALVSSALTGMRTPKLPERVRVSDDEIRNALISEWTNARGNRQKLLRHLRDKLLISCEQSRFARIARELDGERLL